MGALLVPFVLIIGTVISLLLAIIAFLAHPLLGLLAVVLCVGGIVGLARWEAKRIARELPPEER